MSDTVMLVIFGTLKPDGADIFATYGAAAGPLLVQGGGRPVGRFHVREVLRGEGAPKLVAMMEFDSADAIKSVFDSEAYQALLPQRDAAFQDLTIMITDPA